MIRYEHVSESPFAIRVTLDGKMQGFIRRDEHGAYYFARKSGRGESFATVAQVKRSLEEA